MQIGELIVKNYSQLNETDLIIWRYVANHKKAVPKYRLVIWRTGAMFRGLRLPDLSKRLALEASLNLK